MVIRCDLSELSRSSKCAGLAVSRMPSSTCPSTCSLRGDACYGRMGPCGWHWRDLDAGFRGWTWGRWLARLRALPAGRPYRGAEVGDRIPGCRGSLRISRPRLKAEALALQARGPRPAWTYTHYPVVGVRPDGGDDMTARHNRACIRAVAELGYVIRTSHERACDALESRARGLRPVLIVPSAYARRYRGDGRGHRDWLESQSVHRSRVRALPALPGPLCRHAYSDARCIECMECYACTEIVCLPAHGVRRAALDRMITAESVSVLAC